MSNGVMAEQIATLMSAIEASSGRMEAKFAHFKEEMKKNQEESAAKAVKRARIEKPYTFRKKGNEEQSLFNSQLDECLAEMESELSGAGATPALVRAKESFEKGKKRLAARQKLIRIADRSELGWGVVAEYTADELAENSGNENAWRRQKRRLNGRPEREGRNGQTSWLRPNSPRASRVDSFHLSLALLVVRVPVFTQSCRLAAPEGGILCLRMYACRYVLMVGVLKVLNMTQGVVGEVLNMRLHVW